MQQKIIILSVILFFSFFLSACSLPWKSNKLAQSNNPINEELIALGNKIEAPVLSSASLKKFKNYEELQDFLLTINLDLTDLSSIKKPELNNDFYTHSLINKETASLADFSSSSADIIRTEGDYIYALVYNDVFVIKINPVEQSRAITKLSFPDRPGLIYLSSGKLIVIGADTQIMSSSVYQKFKRQSPYTFVKIFNISNPEEPKQIRDLNFEGSYFDSRVIAGHLYLFINDYNEHLIEETPIPRLIDNGKILTNSCETGKKCFAPEVYYFDVPYSSYRLISVNSLDLSSDDRAVSSQAFLLNSAQSLHLANNNFYINYSQRLSEVELKAVVLKNLFFDRLSSDEQKAISSIESLANNISNKLDKSEKILKIINSFVDAQPSIERELLNKEISQALLDKYKAEASNLERSTLQRFSLSKGEAVFRAQGDVQGIILDKSFHEDANSNLQLITTVSNYSDPATLKRPFHNNFYILKNDLKQLSFLEKILLNDKIERVKFSGNLVFLFGSNPKDLSLLDIKNVQVPKFLGKLRLPDSYSYLSSYSDNSLIGFGKATEFDQYANLKNTGLKLSLLDVNNLSEIQELNRYIIGANNSQSLLFNNNRTALFSFNKNIISIPASLTRENHSQHPYFSGVLVFRIDDKKFNLTSQIDHSDGGRYQTADSWCGQDCYDNSVQRSLYINENLYTLSNKYLKINRLADMSPVQAIKLLADTEIDLNFVDTNNDPNVIEPKPQSENLLPIGPSPEITVKDGSNGEQDVNSQPEPEILNEEESVFDTAE